MQYETLKCARLTDGKNGIGHSLRTVGHFMGQRFENIFEVTDFDLNKLYGYKSLSGTMVSNTLYTFGIAGGKTEIRMSVQIHLGDILTGSVHMAEKKIKKQYRENLALLKDILESRQVEHLSPFLAHEKHHAVVRSPISGSGSDGVMAILP